MVLRYIEGFELNAASSDVTDIYLERKLTVEFGIPVVGAGYLIGSSISSSSYIFLTPEFTDDDTWVVNWAWFFPTVATASQAAGIKFFKGGVKQFDAAIRNSESLDPGDRFFVDLKRGAVTLATAGPFWADNWHLFELKVTIHTSTGAYELKVDGVSEVSDTGVNTADTGGNDADQLKFSLDNGSRNMLLDHVVVADSTGADNNDFLGQTIVVEGLPISDGDDTDWNPSTPGAHFSLVNEAMPNANILTIEDPKRVTSETVTDFDRYNMGHLFDAGVPVGNAVLGVSVETCAGMEASGSRTLRAAFKDTGASLGEGASVVVNDTALSVLVQLWDTNPATAAAWTVTTVDDGQFGIKVQA